MQLWVRCRQANHQFLITFPANIRADLPQNLHLICPFDQSADWYHPNEVFATAGNAALPGAVLGGLIGIVGGPLGMLIGGTIGASLGARAQQGDQALADAFNQS